MTFIGQCDISVPRKALKKWLPTAEKIKNNESLQFLGHLLHKPSLWHLNRKSVAKACFFGLFVAMLPLPFHMLTAAVLAIYFNANIPLSISVVWVSNPLTMGPIYYFNYWLGAHILAQPVKMPDFKLSLKWLASEINAIWEPLILGSVIVGLVAGLVGALVINGLWHWNARRHWALRAKKRSQSQ